MAVKSIAGRRDRLIILVSLLLEQIQIHGSDEGLVMVVVVMVVMTAQDFSRLDVFFQFFHVSFQFSPSVLEPGDDLSVGQSQREGNLSTKFINYN